ncbi:MAG: hypothetical protein HOV81_11385 [Kofleriaceae bacterium]|nr:hypothetical protein [Kofleriaceae bacterium]
MADDAGALLVRSGLVSSSALDAARARVVEHGGTLGEQLVAADVVTDQQLTDFYKQRLLVPQVNPNILARLPAKVVAVIPSDMAIELRAIPVSLDGDNNLTIAMSDPSDRHAVDEIAFFTGAYVVRAVATQMQIAWCLAHYYGHVTHLGQRLLQDGSAQPSTRTRPDTNRQRTKGVTAKVEASRHKGLVPGQASVTAAGELVETARDTLEQPAMTGDEPTAIDPPVVDPSAVDAPAPRARSISGEIRVPTKRAPSIKPPLPDDSGEIVVMEVDSGPVVAPPASAFDVDSGPVVTIEADMGEELALEISTPPPEDQTDPALPKPRRKRPAEPDPPELAARAGEVQLATGEAIKKITFDEPRIIISDELTEPPPAPVRPAHLPVEPSIEVSGELRARDTNEHGLPEALSSVFVELDDETDDVPVEIHDRRVDESAPVLLDRRRASDPPTDVNHHAAPAGEIDDDPSDVVVLHSKKPATAPVGKQRAGSRITQVGIGAVTASTRARMMAEGIPVDALDDMPTGSRAAAIDNDPTRVETYAAPARDDDMSDEHIAAPPSPYDDDDTSPHVIPLATKAVPPPSGHVRLDAVKPARRAPDEGDDEPGKRSKATLVMSTTELDAAVPGRRSEPEHLGKRVDYDPLDEGWGQTIPPPLLGAIPGSNDRHSGVIPIADVDSAPLMVAPPAPPERGPRPQSITQAGLSRALEAATSRVLELIHTLDHTENRDQVVAVMIAHLAETHHRAGFFAARAGELTLFAITPRVPSMPSATLRLDRPSTLQDVVGTRLPYRGPMHDDASRQFLTATLGACPPEILLVPVAVRERVVGVLFGDHRLKHTFDDQLALGSRAAGMALERILKAKR